MKIYRFRLLSRLLRRKKDSRKSVIKSKCTLSMESLEQRALLSITPAFIHPSNSNLEIYGSSSNDQVTVSENTAGTLTVVQVSGSERLESSFSKAGIPNIVFYGKEGNDSFVNNTNTNSIVDGGPGKDTIVGGSGDDYLEGGDGNDTIYGRDGDDTIRGGEDDDLLYGGAGVDVIYGDNGEDLIEGGDGDDTLRGGAGNDKIDGGDGADQILGGEGRDLLLGGEGNDGISGNEGSDIIIGGAGHDYLFGGDGNDLIDGGSGNDQIEGNLGRDRISGGDDDDTISGGEDSDLLLGGEGADKLTGGTEDDYIMGQGGNDLLIGDEGDDSLFGGDGDDQVSGRDGNDYLSGGDGDDGLSGAEGADQLHGGEGKDYLTGGTGDDRLFGEAGDDLLLGDEGKDTLYGGEGNDALRGGADGDYLSGDEGDDWLNGEAGDDLLYGKDGSDDLIGDIGNDQLFGGNQNDSLRGDEGNDILDGGAGEDTITGGLGDDLLYGGPGDDALDGGEGSDDLYGGKGDDYLAGGNGNDYIYGEEGNDVLLGGLMSDRLFAGAGNDIVYGEEGNDLLVGDDGEDLLEGMEGNDIIIGGAGVDNLNGKEGEDLLIGGSVTHDQYKLSTLLNYWGSTVPFETRVQTIQSEGYAVQLQSAETVIEDGVQDQVRGGEDQDWLFVPGVVEIYDAANVTMDGMYQGEMISHHSLQMNFVHHIPQLEGFDFVDSIDALLDVRENEPVTTKIPHYSSPSMLKEHLGLFQLVRYDQVTNYAIASGSWSNPAIWSNGVVPQSGANVLVSFGVHVVVDRVDTARLNTIRVDGTLSFSTNRNTQLRVETVVVSHVGRLEIGTETAPIQAGVSARLTLIDSGQIDRNADPFGISRGLITHGTVVMHGKSVTAYETLQEPVTAGTTSFRLSQIPTNWKVGDMIVIAGTSQDNLQDEQRTILSIAGNQITVSPLVYNHLPSVSGAEIHVVNLSRNIIIDSENLAPHRRGHVMFMHNDDVNIYGVAFNGLGRTDKSQPINDPVVDADWNLVSGTGTNPRARYSVHFHRAGTSIGDDAAQVAGSVVNDGIGWGFVNHSSHVDFVSNVAYNVHGAGFVTEVGDETGSFRNNIALHTISSGEDEESRVNVQDFGHGGQGFWFQGAGIAVTGNISASNEGEGFFYFTRGLLFNGKRATFNAANLANPEIAGGEAQIEVDQVPILEFSNNVGYASKEGLLVKWHLRNAIHDEKSVIKDSLFWNNTIGVSIRYSHEVIVQDLLIAKEPGPELSKGVYTNAASKNIEYKRLTVLGSTIGIEVAELGYAKVEGGHFNNPSAIFILPAFEQDRQVLIQGPITFGESPLQDLPSIVEYEVNFEFINGPLHGTEYEYVFYRDSVILNYGNFVNRKLYSYYQRPDAIPFPTPQSHIPNELIGLTALELQELYGHTVGGELTPADVTHALRIRGLLSAE